MPYGLWLPNDAMDEEPGRGLVFIAINADIHRQFEFVQMTWIKHGDFAGLGSNDRDPVIGATDLRRDIEALKADLAALTRHLTSDGRARAADVKDTVTQGVDTLVDKGNESLKLIEGQVRENPRGAIALAFCAGVLANLLLRRS